MKKLEKTNFVKRMGPYNKPVGNIVIGFIASCVQGCIFPTFGIFIAKLLFTYMLPDKEELRSEANKWCLFMFICSLLSFCTGFS